MDTDTRPPFSPLAHLLLPDLLLTLLLTIYPRPLPRLLAHLALAHLALAYLALAYLALHNLRYTSGSALQDYSLGSALIGQLFTGTHLLWLVGPPETWRHERDALPACAQGTLSRFTRILAVVHSPRGVGWNYQVAHIPPRPDARTPRGAFLHARVRDIVLYLLLLDVSQTYMRLNPLFRKGWPLGAQGAPMRLVNILAFMSSPYALLNLQYSVLAMVGVGFGVCGSQVQDWPELFGRWADAWSVRQFWGRTWHQLIRRYYTGDAGKALVSLFGFQRGTNASAYTQLYTAFLLSGLMHAGGDYMVAPAAFGSSIPFFVMQAVAITLEDGVIALGRRAGLRDGPAWRALGYCWVVAWFWWSVPSFVDWSLARGVGRSQALPLSLVESVGKWVGVL